MLPYPSRNKNISLNPGGLCDLRWPQNVAEVMICQFQAWQHPLSPLETNHQAAREIQDITLEREAIQRGPRWSDITQREATLKTIKVPDQWVETLLCCLSQPRHQLKTDKWATPTDVTQSRRADRTSPAHTPAHRVVSSNKSSLS